MVCWEMFRFGSVGREFPHQEDSAHFLDPGHFSPCWYLIIQSSTEFLKLIVEEKYIPTISLAISMV